MTQRVPSLFYHVGPRVAGSAMSQGAASGIAPVTCRVLTSGCGAVRSELCGADARARCWVVVEVEMA